ncbi:unnamed protein product [Oncorhynchus mykiss]|uniref:VWFD domain-containing protein n=1 Tax=Oncorhynchus mykiss TaxID=8022 RepID=A0A060ZR44_ONCMY|nr:unnamed protein product [Oncorhynchus mykiss]
MINSDYILHSYTSFNIYSLLILCLCLGSLIYNETDGAGWCFTSYCNSSCVVEKQARPCPSTTPATVSTVSTTVSTVSTTVSTVSTTTEATHSTTSTLSPTTPYKGCEYVIPPRKDGETWKTDNCTTQTCHRGVITTTPVDCKSVEKPVCENGYPPVKVYDESGCCYHYECECICYGWGDPHYVTFDGQYYSFQENCTYVLIKEIVPRQNFSVIIDNYNCDPSGHATCPQSLIVNYKSYKIVLTPKRLNVTTNMVNITVLLFTFIHFKKVHFEIDII